ncbi:MAG: fibronectin type III domain-containing protein, partial [Bacilli bacterium]
TKAKYVKFLVSDSTNQHGAAAEINVYKTQVEEEEIVVEKAKNLKGEATSKTAQLTWEAPESKVGLVGYVIYKDGKELTTVDANTLSYTVEELRTNTNYGFKVACKYSNGEKSKPVSINIRTKK